jgi:hypothetical protein
MQNYDNVGKVKVTLQNANIKGFIDVTLDHKG